ncbi:hypothetical protein BDV95DRAFT_159016 [Massariosphaeria phaeospora]|uniref:Uncharacterized protein n=1 Tax=Massariosphaeria phaeospora TaxID=100035 RepID=A0A7C8I1B6_9PLEO|nr:hypothetical protein BDV95DRAFT_159016 [Massariosphaeria phaeospora]
MAPGLELRARIRIGSVKSDVLVTDEVLPWSNICGDGVSGDSASLHEGSCAPGVRGTFAAFFIYLKLDGPRRCCQFEHRVGVWKSDSVPGM